MDLYDEEEWKKEKREEIRGKISALSAKIDEANEIIEALSESKKNLNDDIEEWENSYQTYQSVEINSNIFLTDVFEGNMAERLKIRIPNAFGLMKNSVSIMNSVIAGVNEQIIFIQDYISELQQEIRALYTELAGI